MMRRSLLLIPAFAALASTGCVVGSANGAPYSESQRHAYAGFQNIDASAGVEVVVAQGAFDVKAETTDGKDFDNLIVEVRGDTLYIGRKQSMWSWGGPSYRVSVSAPAYSAFEVSSGASLDGSGLSLANLKVNVSSGASIELAGSCADLRVDISSGASFRGEDLRCATAEVDASSGAHAEAFASQAADGNASSGASVNFHGKPANFREDSSSGGSVSAR
jgi:Putative auto-transporter adhesin, head GIN domain